MSTARKEAPAGFRQARPASRAEQAVLKTLVLRSSGTRPHAAAPLSGIRLPPAALAELAADRARQTRMRLTAAAVAAAVLLLIGGLLTTLPESLQRASLPQSHSLQRRRQDKKPLGPTVVGESESSVDLAMNRLDEALIFGGGLSSDGRPAPDGSPAPEGGLSPEDMLRTIRDTRRSGNLKVCNFAWNENGPVLIYQTGLPVDRAIRQCAEALENYQEQNNAPVLAGRGD